MEIRRAGGVVSVRMAERKVDVLRPEHFFASAHTLSWGFQLSPAGVGRRAP